MVFLRLTEQRCSNSRNVRLNASLNSHIYKFHEPVDLEWSLNRALYSAGREDVRDKSWRFEKEQILAGCVCGGSTQNGTPPVSQTERPQPEALLHFDLSSSIFVRQPGNWPVD